MIAPSSRIKRRISTARRRAELRCRGYSIDGPLDPSDIDLTTIYELMDPVWIGESSLTMHATRHAELIFKDIQAASCFKRSKMRDKWQYLQHVYDALHRAAFSDSCVAYDRNKNKTSTAELQVIDAIAETGWARSVRSKPGSPKSSRLVPTAKVRSHFTIDPWTVDAGRLTTFVYLRDRETGEELPFPEDDPVPAAFRSQLAGINEVNSHAEITYSPFDEWADRHIGVRRLRPVHYAIFTDDWDHHGRLYTGKYGHQSLRANERQWIRFNGLPSIEVDFKGMHPRMLYHLRGLEYEDDPYALFGRETTSAQRFLAKTVVTTAINARNRRTAISACNNLLRAKVGRDATQSQKLRRAIDLTGLTFSRLYDLAAEHHQPIADAFASDAGMRLMNLDGKIALAVLNHFTAAGVPALGVHDSFVVPACFLHELMAAMTHFYRHFLGFSPVLEVAA